VIAQSPTDFENWVLNQQNDAPGPAKGSLAATGATLFQNGAGAGQFPNGPACSACHSLTSSPVDKAVPRVGPNLGHLADRATFAGATFDRTDANLARWLNSPSAVKPGARMPTLGLTTDQIKALVAYLDTLK
jgi:cytochrome c oxidase subunit 2